MGISCCNIVLEPHRGTAASFFFTHYRPFPPFLFYVFVTLTVLFLGASLVYVNDLKRTADLVLWFPDRTAACTHSVESVVKSYSTKLNYSWLDIHYWRVLMASRLDLLRCVLIASWLDLNHCRVYLYMIIVVCLSLHY